jgi:hypothetical protein
MPSQWPSVALISVIALRNLARPLSLTGMTRNFREDHLRQRGNAIVNPAKLRRRET